MLRWSQLGNGGSFLLYLIPKQYMWMYFDSIHIPVHLCVLTTCRA